MTSVLATSDASAAALLDGGARWHGCLRSLRQAVEAGRSWALLPNELLPPGMWQHIELLVMTEPGLGRCGAAFVVLPRDEAGRYPHGAEGAALRVCLLHPHGPDQHHGDGPMGAVAQAMCTALYEQTDPVRRVDRRVAFELAQAGLVDDGDVSHLLRAGALDDMPGASGG